MNIEEPAESNSELLALLNADQLDRQAGHTPGLRDRDDERRRRVDELLRQDAARTAEDYYAAAMVFQHGGNRDNYWRAHELAKRSAELGSAKAKWLVAASYDRWLMHGGLPQKYGTQFRTEGERWILWPVDPATTDEDRAAFSVPSLAKAQAHADEMNLRSPPRWERGEDGVVRQSETVKRVGGTSRPMEGVCAPMHASEHESSSGRRPLSGVR